MDIEIWHHWFGHLRLEEVLQVPGKCRFHLVLLWYCHKSCSYRMGETRWNPKRWDGIPSDNFTLLRKMDHYRWFTHSTWLFPIAMFAYQRLNIYKPPLNCRLSISSCSRNLMIMTNQREIEITQFVRMHEDERRKLLGLSCAVSQLMGWYNIQIYTICVYIYMAMDQYL